MDGSVDSSVVIDMDRGYTPAINWVEANPNLIVGITPMVWMEVMLGVGNKSAQARLRKLLQRFEMIYLNQQDMDWAMRQLSIYGLSYHVGVIDCLIAAPSHRLGLPLYTRNLKHFTPLLGILAVQPY
jgi:predicted nucleic acid-binding protein